MKPAQLLITAAMLVGGGGSALAGPPYITDDPEPTRTGGWENYLYVTGTNAPGEIAGQLGVELNYGAAKDLQLSAAIPMDYADAHGIRAAAGDLDIGAKYRFIHSQDGGWLPDVAVFPALTLPTAPRAFDTGRPTLFLPVWVEKDFVRWSTFGGGGYDINPGRGQRDFTLVGWAVTRSFGTRLNLGVELAGGRSLTNLGFGAIYQITRRWALTASGGPGLQTPSRSGASAFYASVQFTN